MSSTTEERKEIYRLRHEEGKSWKTIRKKFPHINYNTLRRIAHSEKKRRARQEAGEEPLEQPQENVKFEQKGAKAEATSKSKTIKTLEQLLEAAEVNLDEWQVDRWVANSWQQAQKNPDKPEKPILVTLHQVKAFLVKNRTTQARERIKDLREDMVKFAPVYPKIPRAKKVNGAGHLLEIALMDLHFGKFAWAMESGANYGMDEAENLFRSAASGLVDLARGQEIEQILLVAGNDLMQVDNVGKTTTRGTHVATEGAHRQHFRRVRIMVREVAEELALVAPVSLRFIPGNHDWNSVYMLGEALHDWFYNNPDVEVINDPRPRQYHLFGQNLIGFTHGHREKHNDLPMVMAAEAPDLWAASRYREFHLGHFHIRRETKYLPLNEVGGVRLRILPSLSKADDWHFINGYVAGVRAAEAYLWHPRKGLTAQYSWLPEAE